MNARPFLLNTDHVYDPNVPKVANTPPDDEAQSECGRPATEPP